MPPVDQTLPEGTDTIITGAGASDTDTDSARTTGAASSSAKAASDAPADIRGLFFERIDSLKADAGDRARDYAQTGKDRITGALDDVVRMIEDAAGEVDDRIGAHYGDYARRAAEGVSGFSDAVKAKDVDDLFTDARTLIARSPGVAVGVAAALGFVVARLARAGLAETAAASNDDAPKA